jgi:hypothetical protein
MSKRRELARLRAAAEAGDVAAAVELSDILMDDDDLAGAEYWSRKAAASGNVTGMMNLGIVLSDKGNPEEGDSWLKTAASSKDPQFTSTAGMAAGVLGRSLLERILAGLIPPEEKNFDEVEHWFKIFAASGYEVAQKDLEYLESIRRDKAQGGANQGSGDDVLQTFEVSYVTFYDGSGHRLGPSRCTLTRTRLIIDDARGGIHQILLRDISGISTPSRFGDPKTLRISLPGQAYDVTFKSKDQKYSAEGCLSRAIHG